MLPIEVVVDGVASRRVGTSRPDAFIAHGRGGAFPRVLLRAGDPEINIIASHLRSVSCGRRIAYVIFYIKFVNLSILWERYVH